MDNLTWSAVQQALQELNMTKFGLIVLENLRYSLLVIQDVQIAQVKKVLFLILDMEHVLPPMETALKDIIYGDLPKKEESLKDKTY